MKSLKTSSRNKVAAARSPLNRNERSFRRGTLMFIEGELSREMFILRQGMVRVLKQEGENSIELATLGPGSVLGELSLLDHQPRGATAQVVEECKATVVDEALLEATLAAVPPWMSNIIRVVVKRLRETMARTERDIVDRSVGGVLRVMLLVNEQEGAVVQGERRLPVRRVKDAIRATIGIGEVETENVFLHLILKDMLYIRRSDAGTEYLVLRDIPVLHSYMSFLRSRQRGTTMPGEDLDAESFDALAYILKAGEKNGRRIKNNVVRIGMQQVELERGREGKIEPIPSETIEALAQSKVVVIESAKTKSVHGSHAHDVIIYNEDTIRKLKVLQKWLPIFTEDVRF